MKIALELKVVNLSQMYSTQRVHYTLPILQHTLLNNIQECKIDFDSLHNSCFILCDLLSLAQLKVLQFDLWSKPTASQLSKLENLLKTNLTIMRLEIRIESHIPLIDGIIKGVTKNKTMISFSLVVTQDWSF